MKHTRIRILVTFIVVFLSISGVFLEYQSFQAHGSPSSSAPLLGGWGGVRLKDTEQNMTGPFSAVFPGEKASNFEQIASRETLLGYNTIRASFAPYCSVMYGLSSSTPPDFMGNYTQGELARAVTIAEHFNMWIIVDYHGYADFANSTLTSCWQNFWLGPSNVSGPKGVVGAFTDQYSRIIWEPLNEPDSSHFPISSTTWCTQNPAPCETNKTAYAAAQYQSWLNADRRAGDNHWVVVQNLCSYGCNLDRALWYRDYPSVNDTVQRVYESLHTYVYYPNMVEHVAYDSNNNSIYDSGDISIVGYIPDNTPLTRDSRLEFVNATNTPSETWSSGKAVIYDVDNNGLYDPVDIPVTGTVPAIGTRLRPDPLLKFVDNDKNLIWNGWGNSTVDTAARQDYLTMMNETTRAGWPILNTEGGPFCGASCPYIVPGAAGYSSLTLRYIQEIINYEDSGQPRMGRLLWPVAPWTKTPNAGEFGSLNPGEWGTIIHAASIPVVPIVDNVSLSMEIGETTISAGTKMVIGVTARNSGEVPEVFDVMLRYNNGIIGEQKVYELPVGAAQALSFTWDTSQVEPGSYVLNVTSTPAGTQMHWSSNNPTMPVSVVNNGASPWFGPLVLPTVSAALIIAAAAGGIMVALHHKGWASILKRRQHR